MSSTAPYTTSARVGPASGAGARLGFPRFKKRLASASQTLPLLAVVLRQARPGQRVVGCGGEEATRLVYQGAREGAEETLGDSLYWSL